MDSAILEELYLQNDRSVRQQYKLKVFQVHDWLTEKSSGSFFILKTLGLRNFPIHERDRTIKLKNP